METTETAFSLVIGQRSIKLNTRVIASFVIRVTMATPKTSQFNENQVCVLHFLWYLQGPKSVEYSVQQIGADFLALDVYLRPHVANIWAKDKILKCWNHFLKCWNHTALFKSPESTSQACGMSVFREETAWGCTGGHVKPVWEWTSVRNRSHDSSISHFHSLWQARVLSLLCTIYSAGMCLCHADVNVYSWWFFLFFFYCLKKNITDTLWVWVR